MPVLKRFLRVKVFAPGNKTFFRLEFKAPKGNFLTPRGIETSLRNAAEIAEAKFPGHEYTLVPLSTHEYNIVWVKELPPEEQVVAEFTTMPKELEESCGTILSNE